MTTCSARSAASFTARSSTFAPGRQFLVADAFWIPPEGDPLGPMALHVTVRSRRHGGCKLHVRQDGYEPSPRWRRYYAVVSRGWQISLTALKRYAEAPPAPVKPVKKEALGF